MQGSKSLSKFTTSQLPDKLVVEAVTQFSQLRSYALTANEILQWSVTIERVVKEIDPVSLCWLVDEMLAGRYEYDRFAGIQQLIVGLSKVERVENNYRFKTDFPG